MTRPWTLAVLFPVFGCIEGPADYSGPDDPTKDYDNDGSVRRPSDGSEPDCEENDATRFPDAPEYCDGRWNNCSTVETWRLSDELGSVTFYDVTGRPTDLTPDWAAGSESAPAILTLDEEGTVEICGGTFFVDLTIASGGVSIHGQTIDGQPTILSGGGIGPILRVDAESPQVVLEDLEFVDGVGNEARAAGGLQVDRGSVALRRSRFANMIGPSGAAINVASSLDIDSVSIEESFADQYHGGGILVQQGAELTADGLSCTECTTVLNDPDISVHFGGAIAVKGSADLARLSLEGNVATLGGAIYNSGSLTISDSFIRRSLSGGGGALYNDVSGVAVIDRCTLSEHSVPLQLDGGAIMNAGSLTLLRTTITNNWAAGLAGGIYNLETGEIFAQEVAVMGNFAENGGNFYDKGTSIWTDSILRGGVAVKGGGIYTADSGTTELVNTAVWFNQTREDVDAGSEGLTGGGAIAVGGGTLTCTADLPFANPFTDADVGARPVFTGNTGNTQWVGGIWLENNDSTELDMNGCGFGAGDDANRKVALALKQRGGVAFAVDGFEGQVECDYMDCLCDGIACTEASLPP